MYIQADVSTILISSITMAANSNVRTDGLQGTAYVGALIGARLSRKTARSRASKYGHANNKWRLTGRIEFY